MRRVMLVVMACAVATGCGEQISTATQAYCPRGKRVDVELPGAPLGGDFGKFKDKAPLAARCQFEDKSDFGCEYIDEFGQLIALTPYDDFKGPDGVSEIHDRSVGTKEAYRKAGSPLPFGILWTDSPKIVARKLNAAGLATRRHWTRKGEQVEILNGECGRMDESTDLRFEFRYGRLQVVTHMWFWV